MTTRPPFDAGHRFEIRRVLGEGGMGVVYEAFDRERREVVALKTMRNVDARAIARFKREFRALHDLAHPNIVALGEMFEGTSEPFFVMELVRGATFLDHVRGFDRGSARSGDFSVGSTSPPDGALLPLSMSSAAPALSAPSVVVQLYDEARLRGGLRQLARAIAAVHEAGLVHRDIKPSNVLVTEDGRVVLLDFGLVAPAEPGASPTASSRTGAVGTVAYMAPEAITGEVGAAADWYSFGVLLYEALTGTLPHTGRTALDIILSKQTAVPPSPRQLVATVPPDLDALCTALLAPEVAARPGDASVLARLGADASGTLVHDATRRETISVAAHPFVGRDEELATLRAAYARSRETPAAVLVEGVSGVGKTRLVEEFLEETCDAEPDALVLAGRCYEREVVSYKAFDGIAATLARYLNRLSRVDLAGLLPLHASLLGRLFPALRRVEAIAGAPLVPDAPDPHDQRRRMFAALRELLSRLAERRRVVCFIDDAQWTDADSLMLMQELLTGEEPPAILLVATVRPGAGPAVQAALRGLQKTVPTSTIQLPELPADEARTLAALLLPGRAPSVHQAVATEAAGHPLFLHALARHLLTSSDDEPTGVSLEQMIGERLSALPDPARRLLEVVALYGGPVTHDVAGRAAELQDGELTHAVHMLRVAHLVRTDGARHDDRILAYHDRVRELVVSTLDDARRVHLHGRIAVALAQNGTVDQDAFALVQHSRAAGQLDQAAWHALVAARHAVAALAFDQAAALFATAIELGGHDSAQQRALRLDHAAALVHAGRGPEAAAAFLLAAEGAEPAVRLDCQRRAAEQWINTGHLDLGMDALRASLDEISEPLAASQRRALARVVWNRARLRVRGLGFRPRVESQVPAESLRRLDVLRTVAHGLAMIDFIRGADFNGRFLLSALATGEPRHLGEALATEVVYLASQGGRAGRRARKVFARMTALAATHPDDAYLGGWVLVAEGGACFFEGRFADADRAFERAEAVLSTSTTGTTAERNNARVFRILAVKHLGQVQRGRALAAEAIRSGQQRGDRYLEATGRLLMVPGLLAGDDVVAARRGRDTVLWSPPQTGYHIQHYHQYNAQVELALYEHAASERLAALRDSFHALRDSMLFRVGMVRAVGHALHGRVCLAASAVAGADAGLRAEAAEMARQLSRETLPCAAVFAHLLRAGLAAAGSADAVAHLRRAVADADRAGMALHAAVARDRLGDLLGGDTGGELRAAAARYARDEGIVNVERLFAATAPGLFPPPRTPAR